MALSITMKLAMMACAIILLAKSTQAKHNPWGPGYQCYKEKCPESEGEAHIQTGTMKCAIDPEIGNNDKPYILPPCMLKCFEDLGELQEHEDQNTCFANHCKNRFGTYHFSYCSAPGETWIDREDCEELVGSGQVKNHGKKCIPPKMKGGKKGRGRR